MRLLISAIGGVLFGHVTVSYALEHGFKDYRFWLGLLSLALILTGEAIAGAPTTSSRTFSNQPDKSINHYQRTRPVRVFLRLRGSNFHE